MMPFGRVYVARVPAYIDGIYNRTTSHPEERSNYAAISVGYWGHRALVSRLGRVEARWLAPSLPAPHHTAPYRTGRTG
jgi:hypothetical protein